MAQAIVNVRMDEELKEKWGEVCDELGVNISTVVTVLAKKMAREKRIPFDVSVDPFYSAPNMKALQESIEQLQAGRFVTKTMEELEAME